MKAVDWATGSISEARRAFNFLWRYLKAVQGSPLWLSSLANRIYPSPRSSTMVPTTLRVPCLSLIGVPTGQVRTDLPALAATIGSTSTASSSAGVGSTDAGMARLTGSVSASG